MVSVTVGTMVAASSENAVQQGSSSNDKIQLVPVTGSGVTPGHSVAAFSCVFENVFKMPRSWNEQSSNSLCPFSLSLPMPKWPMQRGQELWSAPIRALKSPSRNRCSVVGISLMVVSSSS